MGSAPERKRKGKVKLCAVVCTPCHDLGGMYDIIKYRQGTVIVVEGREWSEV